MAEVKSGQVNQQVIDSLRTRGAYANQQFLQAMQSKSQEKVAQTQAGATLGAAQIGAKSRETVAGIQAQTARQMAAMQQKAEDERAAERIMDAQKSRELSVTLAKFREEMETERWKLEKDYRDSAYKRDKELALEVQTELQTNEDNQAILSGLEDAIANKVAATGIAQNKDSQARMTEATLSLNDIARRYNSEAMQVEDTKGLVMDEMLASTLFSSLNEKIADKAKKYGVKKWPDFLDKPSDVFGKVEDPKAAKDMVDKALPQLRYAISGVIGKRTSNMMGLGGPPENVAAKIRTGQIKYGDLLHGIAAYKQVKEYLNDEIAALGLEKDKDTSIRNKSLREAYNILLADINEVMDQIYRVRNDKSNPELQKLVASALDVNEGRGLGARLRDVKRPEDINIDTIVEQLRNEISELAPRVFLGPPEMQERFKLREKLKREQTDILGMLLEQLGANGGYGESLNDEIDAEIERLTGGQSKGGVK